MDDLDVSLISNTFELSFKMKYFKSPVILKAQKRRTNFWKCNFVIINLRIQLLKLIYKRIRQNISKDKDDLQVVS